MYEIKNKSAKRGGKRSGAGRKSLYGAPTKAIRVLVDKSLSRSISIQNFLGPILLGPAGQEISSAD